MLNIPTPTLQLRRVNVRSQTFSGDARYSLNGQDMLGRTTLPPRK